MEREGKNERERERKKKKEREKKRAREKERERERKRKREKKRDTKRKKQRERNLEPQPSLNPSVGSFCHPCITTTYLISYRFPILETSATAFCGTSNEYQRRLSGRNGTQIKDNIKNIQI